VISRGYNLILKATLGNGFSDAQCGFKAVRADVARVLLPLIEDNGWFFDTELLVLAEHNGLRIHEVPVDWVDDPDSRVHVASTARDDLKGIWRMLRSFAAGGGSVPVDALPHAPVAPGLAAQLVRFAGIGAATTALFALLFVALAGPMGPIGADAVALAVCVVINTVANRRVTFSRRGHPARGHEYGAAMAVAAVPVVVTVAALVGLGAAGITSIAADLVVLTVLNALATAGRFVLLRHWVFR
jgi:putative flippase GtrA